MPDGSSARIKYGVIDKQDLIRELHTWDTLYIAGRMHKPLLVLQDDEDIDVANRANRDSALRAALLFSKPDTTASSLLEVRPRPPPPAARAPHPRRTRQRLVGLSFRGDFRMRVGENPHKIRNIVAGQFHELAACYVSASQVRHAAARAPPPPALTQPRSACAT